MGFSNLAAVSCSCAEVTLRLHVALVDELRGEESLCPNLSEGLSASASTYDHRTLKTRLPVRSALFKQRTGGLVVRWVTTSEYPLLYVFASCVFCSVCVRIRLWPVFLREVNIRQRCSTVSVTVPHLISSEQPLQKKLVGGKKLNCRG